MAKESTVVVGSVLAIFIRPVAGAPMESVQEVEAIAGAGLKGDAYATGEGSFNKQKVGVRQVTLINARFFTGSGYNWAEARRNIIVRNTELMALIGKEFKIGMTTFRGVKYCDPCDRPTKLLEKQKSFREAFEDAGGLVAEIIEGGIIRVNDPIIPPKKGY